MAGSVSALRNRQSETAPAILLSSDRSASERVVLIRILCGSLNVLRILLVLLADVFHELFAGHESGCERHLERLRVRAGVVDRDFVDESSEILSGVPFDRVESFGVGMPDEIEPELVIESDRIHDQRVALEVPDRMAVPGWIEIIWMLVHIHEDLAVAVDIPFE